MRVRIEKYLVFQRNWVKVLWRQLELVEKEEKATFQKREGSDIYCEGDQVMMLSDSKAKYNFVGYMNYE